MHLHQVMHQAQYKPLMILWMYIALNFHCIRYDLH